MWDMGLTRNVNKRFYRKEPSAARIVLTRLSFIFILLLVVALIFWAFEKDHIKDTNSDGEFSYIDSLYFTIVTVTTLGYGDIVPITESARMFDAIIITPVRMIVWILFIGTAYQLVIRNYWERFKLERNMKNLTRHVIIAGFGTTGSAAVNELILNGYNQNNLIVIDKNEEMLKNAAEIGATGLQGDATREEILLKANIRSAKVLLVVTPQDDTNVLVTLTAKDLNPNLKIISRVSQYENIKQLKRAGASLIISPSLTSGNLMAMAVSNGISVKLIGDLLTTSRGANVLQRKLKVTEIGQSPKNIKNEVVISIVRDGKKIGPKDLDKCVLKENDLLILIG